MRAGRKHTTEIRRTPARSLRAGITSKARRVTACGLTLLCALALVGGIGAQNVLADEPVDQAAQAQDGQAVKNKDNGSTYTVAVPQDGGSGDIQVTVDAPEGSFSQDVTLKADLVQDEKDNDAVASELDKAEVAYDGFVALDVRFEDADGNEVEPAQPVDVKFELPAGVVPEDAKDLAVHHLAEDESGAVASVDTVADAADATEGTVDTQADAAVAEFSVDGFSTFTITWLSIGNDTDVTVNCYYYDENGERQGIPAGTIPSLDQSLYIGSSIQFNEANDDLAIDGYTFNRATYEFTGDNESGELGLTSIEIGREGSFSNRHWYVSFNDGRHFNKNNQSVTINLYYTLNEQPAPDPDPGPSDPTSATVTTGKTADLREDGNYDLTLSVSGDRGSSTQKAAVDVLFIVDRSSSMTQDRQNAVNSAVDTLISTLQSDRYKDNIDAQYGVVAFAGSTEHRGNGYHDYGTASYGWTSNGNNALGWIEELNYSGGTNYQQAIYTGKQMLANRDANRREKATTFVIFISDGIPTYRGVNVTNGTENQYRDNGNGQNDNDGRNIDAAVEEIGSMDCDYFYAIGMGSDFGQEWQDGYWDRGEWVPGGYVDRQGTANLKQLANAVDATYAGDDNVYSADDEDLSKAFGDITASITFFAAEDVTITDPLSQYADLVLTNGAAQFTITITDGNGFTWTDTVGNNGTVTFKDADGNDQIATARVSDDNRIIYLDLPDTYELEEGYTYSISTVITPSDAAKQYEGSDTNTDNQQTPDDNTGTHSILGEDGQKDKGFWSNDNDNAKVTYTANNVPNLEAPFPKPVIQVQGPASVTIPAGGLEVTKSVDDWATLTSNEFSFVVEAIATGEEGQDGYTSDDDAADFAWGESHEGTTLEVDNGVENPSDIHLVHKGKALTLTSDMIGNTYSYVYTEDRDASRGKGYKPDDAAWKVTITVSEVDGELHAIAHVYRDADGADEDGAYSWELCVWNEGDQVWGPTSDEENAGIDLTARDAETDEPLIVLPFNNTTFDLDILKQDGSENPLPHARFSVTLEDANGAVGTAAKDLEALSGETGSDGRMSFDGLMVGAVYELAETYYPAGYEDGEPLLSKFIQVRYDENRRYVLHFVEKSNEGNWVPVSGSEGRTLDEDGVTFTVTVENNQIADLPTSGSSGTVILGAAGVAAVTVAAAYLAHRKGMLSR